MLSHYALIALQSQIDGGTPMEIDRSKLSKCLAKAIAYQQVDNTEAAEQWARKLIVELNLANILSMESIQQHLGIVK